MGAVSTRSPPARTDDPHVLRDPLRLGSGTPCPSSAEAEGCGEGLPAPVCAPCGARVRLAAKR